jgi:hypothetical protein
MSQTRDVLLHLSVVVAIRGRKCHHSRGKHSIPAGGKFLSIRESGSPSSKNYCLSCAEPILSAAKLKLSSIVTELHITTTISFPKQI